MKLTIPDTTPLSKLLDEITAVTKRSLERQRQLDGHEKDVARLERDANLDSDDDINALVAARTRRDLWRGQLPKLDGELAQLNARLKAAVASMQAPGCSQLDNDLLLAESERFREHLKTFVLDAGLREQVVSMVMPHLPYVTSVPTWRAFATAPIGRDSSGVQDAEFAMAGINQLRDYLKSRK